jgi:hypothetical protein
MDVTHTLAAGLSVSRIGLGAILLARPSAVSDFWIGRSGRTPGTQVVARGFGGRDLALGLGGLRALARHRDEEARAWLAGQALADAVDAVATVVAGHKLPERRRRIALVMAAGGAVTGAVSAALLGRGAAVRRATPHGTGREWPAGAV